MKPSPQPRLVPPPLSAKARRTQEGPVTALMAAAVGNPDLVNLAAGLVDPRTLPTTDCAEIAARILSDPQRAQAALQYDTTLGLRPLRDRLLQHLEQLEGRPASSLGLTADHIVITTGSQQTLYLVADCLLDPGDIVITGNPSYYVFSSALQSLGAQVLPVPMDDDGMGVEAVAALLHRLDAQGQLARVKFIYCTSYFDNPTGLTLPLPRRRRLVEIARQFSRDHRILILEDAAYRELHYDAAAAAILPSIKSFDPENRYTVLTQTFSKAFAPGLKLGYTALPADLLQAILHQKGNHDFGSASLCQHIALEAMASGVYQAHLEVLRQHYHRKRDAMLHALESHMAGVDGAHWLRPAGGLYVWLTLAEGIDTSLRSRMFQACLKRGVIYVPGDSCFHPDEQGRIPRNHLRLSFGQVAIEKIDEGISRLAAVVREEMNDTPGISRLKSGISGSKSHSPAPSQPHSQREGSR